MVTHHHSSGLMVVSKKGSKKITPADIGSQIDPDSIREELTAAKNKKLLLVFVWVTDEELRLLLMHPESISWDVTGQTNRQKRDPFVGCGKDGDNNGFHGCHAFLPSQKRWIFCVLFRICIPLVWGQPLVERNRLSLTDGDADECIAFGDAVKVSFCVSVSVLLVLFLMNVVIPGWHIQECIAWTLHTALVCAWMEEQRVHHWMLSGCCAPPSVQQGSFSLGTSSLWWA